VRREIDKICSYLCVLLVNEYNVYPSKCSNLPTLRKVRNFRKGFCHMNEQLFICTYCERTRTSARAEAVVARHSMNDMPNPRNLNLIRDGELRNILFFFIVCMFSDYYKGLPVVIMKKSTAQPIFGVAIVPSSSKPSVILTILLISIILLP